MYIFFVPCVFWALLLSCLNLIPALLHVPRTPGFWQSLGIPTPILIIRLPFDFLILTGYVSSFLSFVFLRPILLGFKSFLMDLGLPSFSLIMSSTLLYEIYPLCYFGPWYYNFLDLNNYFKNSLQNLGTKNKLLVKFRDQNSILSFNFFFYKRFQDMPYIQVLYIFFGVYSNKKSHPCPFTSISPTPYLLILFSLHRNGRASQNRKIFIKFGDN